MAVNRASAGGITGFGRARSFQKMNAYNPLPSFQNVSGTDLLTIMAQSFIAPGYGTTSPSVGGTLTVNSLSYGTYDYCIYGSSVAINSFTASEWFTSTADTNAALIAVNGDLIIPNGITFTPAVRKKFVCLYVAGNLTLNGSISMSLRGSAGQAAPGDLRIATGTFSGVSNPNVPATGGAGASARNVVGGDSSGNSGTAGSNGGCGGGGSGSPRSNAVGDSVTAGGGSAGSGFSGGSGGGGAVGGNGTSSSAGAVNGGAGGNANGGAGGAGNPNGAGGTVVATGTGGVLIVIVRGSVFGSGSLTAAGARGNTSSAVAGGGGGGSGGGSVTLMYGADSSTTTVTAAAGAGGTSNSATIGGAGGAGSARKLAI